MMAASANKFHIAIDYNKKKKTNTKVAASKMKHQLFSKQRILGVLLIIIGSDISLELTQTCSWITCRLKKVFSEIWQNSQENTCDRVSFLIKLQAWPATLWKKRLCHKCFPVNFVKFLRTPFYTEQLWWLLLFHFLYENAKRKPTCIWLYENRIWEH